MLNKLRDATNTLHTEIEEGNLAGDIMSHTISLENYKLLLLQNFIAYNVVDREIAKFIPEFSSNKANRLQEDLSNLKVDTSIYKEFEDQFSIDSIAEAWGAWYVVEGSVLGGMMISKELIHCELLSNIEKHYFFNGDRSSVEGWRSFGKGLKQVAFTEAEELAAINKAKETFKFFGLIFNSLKPAQAVNA